MNFILDSVGPSFVCFVGPSFVYGSKFCLFCLPDGSLGFFFFAWLFPFLGASGRVRVIPPWVSLLFVSPSRAFFLGYWSIKFMRGLG